jgi:hypothetical protein
MRITLDKSTYQPPFSVVLLDATDAYYYADFMGRVEEAYNVEQFGRAIALCDALFVKSNYNWESLAAMNELDAGYDARVYDSTGACVYAAHTRYTKCWIGEHQNGLVFSARIQEALQFATETHEIHQKQKRKGKEIPFITHPLTVGLILARAGASENVIVAGILHDTIEDSSPEHKVTRTIIAERFGHDVAELVDSVTETNKHLPWEERKRQALAHIETFSHDSLLVKSADVLANLREIIADRDQYGDEVWARFNAPKGKLVTNAANVVSAVLKRWQDNPLVEDLGDSLKQLSRDL